MKIVEFLDFNSLEEINWSKLNNFPTICLIATNDPIDQELIKEFTNNALKIGCLFFMTWGKEAENIHDEIDNVLEDSDSLEIPTTSHYDETWEETIHFALHSTYPETKDFRFLLVLNNKIPNASKLLDYAKNLSNKKA